MKLTLNRREEKETGLFKKPTVYYLDVSLEATPEEMALIRKHNWLDRVLCEVGVQEVRVPGLGGLLGRAVQQHLNNRVSVWKVGDVVGTPKQFPFDTIEQLAHAEGQIIENARTLKQQLGAAVGFASGGPQEVEL